MKLRKYTFPLSASWSDEQQTEMLQALIMNAVTGGDSGHDIGLGRAEPWRGAKACVPGICVPPPAAGHGVGRIPAHGHLMPPAPGKIPPSHSHSHSHPPSRSHSPVSQAVKSTVQVAAKHVLMNCEVLSGAPASLCRHE